MKIKFSSRGAYRGISLAIAAICFWMAWAIGYSQGIDTTRPQMTLVLIEK
jgi:hypothetical protein